jgi:uncharacterized Zn-finger protein
MVASHFDNPARFDGGSCRLRLSSIAGVSVVIQVSLSLSKVNSMSDHVVPHFHNDAGVPVIEIGSQEFMCVGANPPFDHPHVFLDLGNDNEIICPYCSTLYRYAADLAAGEARPPECVLKDKVA